MDFSYLEKFTFRRELSCFEVVHLTFLLHVFSIQVKFRACYIIYQWDVVQNKIEEWSYIFSGTFLVVFVVFHNKICVLNTAYFF